MATRRSLEGRAGPRGQKRAPARISQPLLEWQSTMKLAESLNPRFGRFRKPFEFLAFSEGPGRRLPIHSREFHFSTLVFLRYVPPWYFEFGRKESRDVRQIEHLPFVFNPLVDDDIPLLILVPVTHNYFERFGNVKLYTHVQ